MIKDEDILKLKETFEKILNESKENKRLLELLKSSKSKYSDIHDYAVLIGESSSAALLEHIKVLDKELISKLLNEQLKEISTRVNGYGTTTISNLNKEEGLGIKGIPTEYNQDKTDGLVNKVDDYETLEQYEWVLKEPIINNAESVADKLAETNMQFHADSGLDPKIIRTATGKCCEWCQNIVGTYDYESVKNTGNDVFRRHQRCRCLVEFKPVKGKRVNVHTHQESGSEEDRRVSERRKFFDSISNNPSVLSEYTPETLKQKLEESGFNVMPLSRGSLKDVPFEEGGGFKTHIHGDGMIQFHPSKNSHHEGAYYKISIGKKGIRRYNLDGKKI